MADEPPGAGKPILFRPETYARHADAVEYIEGLVRTRAPLPDTGRWPGLAPAAWGLLASGGTVSAASGLTLGSGTVKLCDRTGTILPANESVTVYNAGGAISGPKLVPLEWVLGDWTVCGCGAVGNTPISVGWLRIGTEWCRVVPGVTVTATSPGGAVIDSKVTDSAGACLLAIPPADLPTTTITATKAGYTACTTNRNKASDTLWPATYWPFGITGMLFLAPEHLTLGTSVGSLTADLWIDTSTNPMTLYYLAPKTLTGLGNVYTCTTLNPGCIGPPVGTSSDVLVTWRCRLDRLASAVGSVNFISTEPGVARNGMRCDFVSGDGSAPIGLLKMTPHQVGSPCTRWLVGVLPCNFTLGATQAFTSVGQAICANGGLVASGTLSAGGLVTGAITATEP